MLPLGTRTSFRNVTKNTVRLWYLTAGFRHKKNCEQTYQASQFGCESHSLDSNITVSRLDSFFSLQSWQDIFTFLKTKFR